MSEPLTLLRRDRGRRRPSRRRMALACAAIAIALAAPPSGSAGSTSARPTEWAELEPGSSPTRFHDATAPKPTPAASTQVTPVQGIAALPCFARRRRNRRSRRARPRRSSSLSPTGRASRRIRACRAQHASRPGHVARRASPCTNHRQRARCNCRPPSAAASPFRQSGALRLPRWRRSFGGATCSPPRSRCSRSSRRAAACSPSPLVPGGRGWRCRLVSRLGVTAVVVLGALTMCGAERLPRRSRSRLPSRDSWRQRLVRVRCHGADPISGATDTTCPVVKTFHTSTDVLDCTATDGTPTIEPSICSSRSTRTSRPSPARARTGSRTRTAGTTHRSRSRSPAATPTSGIASCQQLAYNGPDSATASVSGTCRDVAGNVSAPFSFALKYDATPPSVSANPARGPDGNGWYNHPVSVSFGGTDATSGIDSCTSGSYSGPDTSGTTVSGSCSDKAGNTSSATVVAPVRLDGSKRQGRARAPPGRERLVQPSGRGHGERLRLRVWPRQLQRRQLRRSDE